MQRDEACREACEDDYETCLVPCRRNHDRNCYAQCMEELASCYRRCGDDDKERTLRRIREVIPMAILVLLGTGALAALIVCFASGVCELAAILAGLGIAATAALLFILRKLGIGDSASGAIATAGSDNQSGSTESAGPMSQDSTSNSGEAVA